MAEEIKEIGLRYCWVCEKPFYEVDYCNKCTTFKCPNCGSCFCSLTPEARRAVINAMKSYGFWFSNPRKKPSGKGKLVLDIFFSKLKERGVVKDYDEFERRISELIERYSDIHEEARREAMEVFR